MKRIVMTSTEAVSKLRRAGIRFDGEVYTLIRLPSNGPGLKLWAAIDCLCNHNSYHAFRKPAKQRRERAVSLKPGPEIMRAFTDRGDENRKGEIVLSQLISKDERQSSSAMALLAAFGIQISDYEKVAI